MSLRPSCECYGYNVRISLTEKKNKLMIVVDIITFKCCWFYDSFMKWNSTCLVIQIDHSLGELKKRSRIYTYKLLWSYSQPALYSFLSSRSMIFCTYTGIISIQASSIVCSWVSQQPWESGFIALLWLLLVYWRLKTFGCFLCRKIIRLLTLHQIVKNKIIKQNGI